MKKDNLYKKNNIVCFIRKAAYSIVICFVLIGLLFVFSCTPLDSSKQPSDSDTLNDTNTTNNNTNNEVQKDSAYNNGDEATENDVSEATENKDTNKEQPEETKAGDITINVYYADAMGEYLVGEARVVSSENKYVDALNELMKLPIDGSLHRLVPESTKINSITVENGLAKVDLSKEFVEDRFQSDTVDILLIYSIVNTLTEFPEVNSVSFYIDGEKLDILGGLAIDEPIFRRSDLIKN